MKQPTSRSVSRRWPSSSRARTAPRTNIRESFLNSTGASGSPATSIFGAASWLRSWPSLMIGVDIPSTLLPVDHGEARADDCADRWEKHRRHRMWSNGLLGILNSCEELADERS